MEKRTDLFFFSSEMCKQSCMQSPYRHSGRACIHSCIHSCKHSCIQKGSVRKGGCKIAERSRLIIGTKSCPGFFSSIGYLPKYYCCVGHFSLLRWPSIIALPGRFRCLMPSFPTEGRRRFCESPTLKFLSNSSIIQKNSITLSLVIIACSFCCILIFNYKYAKCRRDYQLFLNSSYPELA